MSSYHDFVQPKATSSNIIIMAQEAYTAFEKRQAAIRSQRESNAMKDWMDEAGFEVEWKQSGPGDVKRRAAAAKAAASARRWRDYQRRQRDRDTIYLAAGE